MKDEIVNKKKSKRDRQREENYKEEEEEGKLTEEFKAQAFVYLPSLYLRL